MQSWVPKPGAFFDLEAIASGSEGSHTDLGIEVDEHGNVPGLIDDQDQESGSQRNDVGPSSFPVGCRVEDAEGHESEHYT
eukprot:1282926-Prorocentrum_lima.AAC.1